MHLFATVVTGKPRLRMESLVPAKSREWMFKLRDYRRFCILDDWRGMRRFCFTLLFFVSVWVSLVLLTVQGLWNYVVLPLVRSTLLNPAVYNACRRNWLFK